MHVSLLCATSCRPEGPRSAWRSLELCPQAAQARPAAEFGRWPSVPDTPQRLPRTSACATTLIYTIPGTTCFTPPPAFRSCEGPRAGRGLRAGSDSSQLLRSRSQSDSSCSCLRCLLTTPAANSPPPFPGDTSSATGPVRLPRAVARERLSLTGAGHPNPRAEKSFSPAAARSVSVARWVNNQWPGQALPGPVCREQLSGPAATSEALRPSLRQPSHLPRRFSALGGKP